MENNVEAKLKTIYKAINQVKGEAMVTYDFRLHSPFLDYVVIVSANNMRKTQALADNIMEKCREQGYDVRKEGNHESRWILIDAKDIVVHVFLDEERDVYRLERLYSDIEHWEGDHDL